MQDGREILTRMADFAAAWDALSLPTLLIIASQGLFGQPPGPLPADAVADARGAARTSRWRRCRCRSLLALVRPAVRGIGGAPHRQPDKRAGTLNRLRPGVVWMTSLIGVAAGMVTAIA